MTTPTLTAADARRAARNASAIAAASLISKGVLFGWQLLLTRFLGDAQYGVYGTIGGMIGIAAAVPAFGMGMIVIRDVARRPENARRYLAATLAIQTTLAILAYGGLLIAAALGGYDAVIRGLLAVAGINLLVDILGNMANDQLLAHEKMLATSAVSVGHILILILLAASALSAGYGLPGLYAVTIAAGLVRTGAFWVLLAKTGVRPAWPPDGALMRSLLADSAPLAMSGFLGMAYQNADKLLTTRLIGVASTGHLTAAFVIIVGVVELLSTTVLTALYPMMSRFHGEKLYGVMVEKVTFFTVIVSMPVGLVFTVYSAAITLPLFGEDFAPSADILQVLIWYAVITMAGNVLAQAMMVENRQRSLLLIRACGLGLNITLLVILLPVVGVTGAAFASVIAESVVLVAFVLNARVLNLMRIVPRLLRLLAAAGVTLAVLVALRELGAVIGIGGGLVTYTAAVLALRVLAPEDWDVVRRILSALPGGATLVKLLPSSH